MWTRHQVILFLSRLPSVLVKQPISSIVAVMTDGKLNSSKTASLLIMIQAVASILSVS